MDKVVNQDRLWKLEGALFLISAVLSVIVMVPAEGVGLTVFGKAVWASVGYAAAVVLAFHTIFRWKAWKWRRFYPWLVRVPDLTGTWIGTLRSGTFGDTDQRHFHGSRLPAVLTIKQQFDRIVAKTFHPKSRNTTLSCTIVGEDPDFQLFLVYSNRPESDDDAQSHEHDGCAVYDFDADRVRTEWEIKGTYWTNKLRRNDNARDRGTWGYIDLRWKQPKLAGRTERDKLLRSLESEIGSDDQGPSAA